MIFETASPKNKQNFPFLMKFLLGFSALLCAVSAAAFFKFRLDWLEACAITFGTIAYHFFIRLLSPALLRAGNCRYDYQSPWFRQKAWEPKLYRCLQVKKWKNHVPTYNPGEFSLKAHSLPEIAVNMCHAEAVHELIIALGFVSLLFAVPFGSFAMFLLTALAAGCIDGMFVVIQRYNRPRVVKLLEKYNRPKRDEYNDF